MERRCWKEPLQPLFLTFSPLTFITLTLLWHTDLTRLSETRVVFFFLLTAIHANSLLRTSDFYSKRNNNGGSNIPDPLVSLTKRKNQWDSFRMLHLLNSFQDWTPSLPLPSPPLHIFVHIFTGIWIKKNSHIWKALI